jgi:serine phosphatase RsbU (regulator of sigma subunit)
MEVRGSLLGIFDQAEYLDESVQLQPGDKFLLYSDGTEALIGSFDEITGFTFTDEFLEIKDLAVAEMMEKFTSLAQHQEMDPAEVDDITAVALEVL